MIKDQVHDQIAARTSEFVIEKGTSLQSVIQPLLDSKSKICILSAGGDGTMNSLVNYLLSLDKERFQHITLGAIGLGSSNDFLKPFQNVIKNIPVRIGCNGETMLHDVGRIRYMDELGVRQDKYFIVNASLGVTAQGNWNFNQPGNVLRILKKVSSNLAILYTSVQTIFNCKNQRCHVEFNDQNLDIPISNINILKIPFVSGSLHYDNKIQPNDGRLGVHICTGMSKRELLTTLLQLSKGKFQNGKNKLSADTAAFSCRALTPFIFEYDGETDQTTDLAITVIPQSIRILKS
jgi:diacylglycerol kinase family enzyme